MKKALLIIIVSVVTIINISCSSDNDIVENQNSSEKLLKSRVYLNPSSGAPNYNEYYEYENGFLKSVKGFSHLLGEYDYSDGKLISMNNQYKQFSYEYYQNGKLKKRNEVGTNNYIELFYETNKVITHRFYEFGGNNSALEKRELLLDNQGRIIKMTDLAQDQSAIDVEYEIYEYDNNGNIIKKTTKQLNSTEETTIVYKYENIKNPYFYSYKKYYDITYYLDNFIGLSIYNDRGLTPNLIKSSNSTYESNNENNPIKQFKGQYEISYEYFE